MYDDLEDIKEVYEELFRKLFNRVDFTFVHDHVGFLKVADKKYDLFVCDWMLGAVGDKLLQANYVLPLVNAKRKLIITGYDSEHPEIGEYSKRESIPVIIKGGGYDEMLDKFKSSLDGPN